MLRQYFITVSCDARVHRSTLVSTIAATCIYSMHDVSVHVMNVVSPGAWRVKRLRDLMPGVEAQVVVRCQVMMSRARTF